MLTMELAPGVASTNKFDKPVRTWRDIPGWFHWRDHQEEAAAHFADGSRFVAGGRDIRIVGVDTARGSGPEGRGEEDAHGPAVDHGGGTFAGLLHRNIIDCGLADTIQLPISDSVAASDFFADGSLAWVHIDARHEYESVVADIEA